MTHLEVVKGNCRDALSRLEVEMFNCGDVVIIFWDGGFNYFTMYFIWPFYPLLLLLPAAALDVLFPAAVTAANAAAAVGCQAAPFAAGYVSCSTMQGLPLAALLQLLLQIQDKTIVCSSILPLPRLKLATSPLALANHQLFCYRQDLFNQAQPGQVSILEHSADANPLCGPGSMADRPHRSQLSLSTMQL